MLPAAAGTLGQGGDAETGNDSLAGGAAAGTGRCYMHGCGQAWWHAAVAGQSDASQAVLQPALGPGQSPRAPRGQRILHHIPYHIPHHIPYHIPHCILHRILHRIPHRIPHRSLHCILHRIPHRILHRSQGSGSWWRAMRSEIWKYIKRADLFSCGSKYLAGSRECDPESRGFGIALLLSRSRCDDLYLQRRVLEYPPVMSELMMLFSPG